ncbi:MAG: HAD family hydrolase [Anaerolineales bacterium]|jgi:phosphoglycolate phosphatase-like HAD superfamily hydrolase|nr:HAD family hydrolase [Anaerolineales bacterium]
MSKIPPLAQELIDFQPKHPFFVGIDSDGCAFDAMELKQKECFIPSTIRVWGLQPISKYARETAEWVNLYSKWRGANRWPALVKVFELLAERPEVQARGVHVPEGKALKEFIASGFSPSEAGLKAYIASGHGEEELWRGLEWTRTIDSLVAATVRNVPPFPFVRQSLQKLQGKADLMVVSTTASDALTREWGEHGLAQYMALIAGQDKGTKKQHLEFTAKGKYNDDRILMIGDALGDCEAAHAVHALFYPIIPGSEERSWLRFHDEASEKLLNGTYAGAYEAALIAEFEKLLSDTPPWQA